MSVYKDPNTFKWDTTAITGCTRVEVQNTSRAETSLADDGAGTHFVRHGLCRFVATFIDEAEARKLQNKTTAAKNVTFLVDDEADAAGGTVTLTKVKTGGMRGGYADGAEVWTVEGVCDSASDPTA
ncbi:MAG TPA: hypothetical protein VM238_22515 [Phycisphaerae bacterium]|nr:hypothetical protein [Phycisphaerae bacterium]